jgi:hypothetical protein
VAVIVRELRESPETVEEEPERAKPRPDRDRYSGSCIRTSENYSSRHFVEYGGEPHENSSPIHSPVLLSLI